MEEMITFGQQGHGIRNENRSVNKLLIILSSRGRPSLTTFLSQQSFQVKSESRVVSLGLLCNAPYIPLAPSCEILQYHHPAFFAFKSSNAPGSYLLISNLKRHSMHCKHVRSFDPADRAGDGMIYLTMRFLNGFPYIERQLSRVM